MHPFRDDLQPVQFLARSRVFEKLLMIANDLYPVVSKCNFMLRIETKPQM